MNATKVLGFAAAAALLAAPALPADWTLRVFGSVSDGSGTDTVTMTDGVQVAVAGRAAGAMGIGLELAVGERAGLELELMAGHLAASTWVATTIPGVSVDESLGFAEIGAGLHFDLLPERRARLYVGPRVAYWKFDRLHVDIGERGQVSESVSSSSEVALGALIGAELPLGSGRWRLAGSLRYLEAVGSGSGRDSRLRPGPLRLTFGVARRF